MGCLSTSEMWSDAMSLRSRIAGKAQSKDTDLSRPPPQPPAMTLDRRNPVNEGG